MTITDEQYKKILKKYENLMFTIAHRIGGDKITNDFDDSIQNLSMSCLEAVSAYQRNTNKTFEEFFDTTGFDKYIKTCLWNKKNNVGAKITKRKPLSKGLVSLDEELIDDQFEHLDTSSVLFNDVPLSEECREIVDLIGRNPKLIKPNGSININKLAREINKPKQEIDIYVNQLKSSLSEYHEE
tara:strand:- start:256 stop:807 length:552 start_codon:yes stop_codon:yes gene_type:complete